MPTPPAEPPPAGSPPAAPAPADVQATFAATLVDEWVRDGLTDAVVCPGSRSTPLALALADRGDLRVHVHHDERSGAFLALGIGVATGRPAVVLTTSGTAAVELHPAVVEADLAGVPLLACTADRPPELRDVGAPQAIDQVHLYGRAVRWYGDPGVPEPSGAGRWRAFAARAFATTRAPRPGPVHLNLPFREPLVGSVGELPPARGDGPWVTVADVGPDPGLDAVAEVGPDTAPDGVLDGVVARLVGRRGVVVAGAAALDGAAVHAAARALGWPVLAEPRSPAWIAAATLVDHADALVRSGRAAELLRPEAILRIGHPGSSRVVNEWLAASGADEVVVGAPAWSDPAATAAAVVHGRADVVVAGLTAAARRDGPSDGSWLDAWATAAAAARRTVDRLLADGGDDPPGPPAPPGAPDRPAPPDRPGAPAPPDGAEEARRVGGAQGAEPGPVAGAAPVSEPAVARAVVRAVPDGGRLVVSSSMPVRDVERYARPRPGGSIVVHANRGANGIDGVVSTAVGVAAGSGGPTVLLIGDVAFLHDGNGLLGAAARGIDLVCVVVDNDGGGIFSFLPQARLLDVDRFEMLFGTPHGMDLVALASAHGVAARRLGADEDVEAAVAGACASGGVQVLVVATDRAENARIHQRLDSGVAVAVDAALDGRAGSGSDG